MSQSSSPSNSPVRLATVRRISRWGIGCVAFVLTLSVIGTALSERCFADDAPLVYVLDMDKVVADSIVGKAARANLEEEVRKSEGKLSLQRAELERLQTDLEKQSALLAPAAMEEKKEVVARKARDFERAVQDQREALSRAQATEMKKVISEIQDAVKEVSSRGAFPIILEKDPRVVVFANERIDLTGEVVAAMDARKLTR